MGNARREIPHFAVIEQQVAHRKHAFGRRVNPPIDQVEVVRRLA
jgi:hypothetical protein